MNSVEIPCKTCITRSICRNTENHLKWKAEYGEHFTSSILRKCYILRVWLKRDDCKNDRYKIYNEFFEIDKYTYGTLRVNQIKDILKRVLKRMVVKRVLYDKGI